jgi:hypothetical protein
MHEHAIEEPDRAIEKGDVPFLKNARMFTM